MARSFNGSTQRFDHQAGVAVNAYPTTFSAWFYPTSTAGGILLAQMDRSSPGTEYLQINIAATTLYGIARLVRASSGANATTTNAATVNSWNHLTGIFTTTNNRVAILNGDTANKGTNTTSLLWPSALDGISFGARYTNGGEFTGYIAELAIWDVALTEIEVIALSKRYSPLLIRPARLQGYWPLLWNVDPEQDYIGRRGATGVDSPTFVAHSSVIYPTDFRMDALGSGQISGPVTPSIYRRRIILVSG